jgi:hypothetical protein
MRFVFACVLAGAFAANANPNEQLIFAQGSVPEVAPKSISRSAALMQTAGGSPIQMPALPAWPRRPM